MDAISAELKSNCNSLATRYGIKDEKVAMVILYHEVMWNLVDKLIQDQIIAILHRRRVDAIKAINRNPVFARVVPKDVFGTSIFLKVGDTCQIVVMFSFLYLLGFEAGLPCV